eukprot:jgi/Hompol1/6779/HPOL_005098-RA
MSAAMDTYNAICEAIDTMKSNKEEMLLLSQRIALLFLALSKGRKNLTQEYAASICKLLDNIKEFVTNGINAAPQQPKRVVRFFQTTREALSASSIADQIKEFDRQLTIIGQVC